MSIRILALAAATALAAGSVSAAPTATFGTGVNSDNYGNFFQIASKDGPTYMTTSSGPSDPTPTFGTGVNSDNDNH